MSFLEAQSSSEGGIALYFSISSTVYCLNKALKPLDSCSGIISYKLASGIEYQLNSPSLKA